MIASITAMVLDALQDYVRRQKKRLGLTNDEAAS
jgi:hypothetical protein